MITSGKTRKNPIQQLINSTIKKGNYFDRCDAP
jgi:hypothetical protein